MSAQRLAMITSRFPIGPKETFLRDEITELAKSVTLEIIPAIPGMFSARVFLDAALEGVRQPFKALQLFYRVCTAPHSVRARLRNAAIFPKGLSVARVLRRHAIQHVHAYWLSAPSTVAYIAAELNEIPWSATGHRYDLVDYNLTTVGATNAGFMTTAQSIRAISQRGREQIVRALPETTVSAVHLGIQLPPARSRKRVPRKPLRLLCAANFVSVKGHRFLLEALSVVTRAGIGVHCTLAGSGPKQEQLERLTHELHLDTVVRFAGNVKHAELLAQLDGGSYDVAILTSIDEGMRNCEGIPVALMEAMAVGLPCIATRSGSIPELVDSSNGILVDTGDVAGIAEAIKKLSRGKALYARLSAGARAKVERDFSVTTTAADMYAILFRGERRLINVAPMEIRTDQCVFE